MVMTNCLVIYTLHKSQTNHQGSYWCTSPTRRWLPSRDECWAQRGQERPTWSAFNSGCCCLGPQVCRYVRLFGSLGTVWPTNTHPGRSIGRWYWGALSSLTRVLVQASQSQRYLAADAVKVCAGGDGGRGQGCLWYKEILQGIRSWD